MNRLAGTIVSGFAVESQCGSVEVTFIRHFMRLALTQPLAKRSSLRGLIRDRLLAARDPNRGIDALIEICTTEGGADGLDVAIDILSRTDSLLSVYAWDYLQRDLLEWNRFSDRAYQPNDDHWYILLRSVARARLPERERFRFISCCADATSRGIREGVVEGLRDLATPSAILRLGRFATEDADPFIQQIAREALADLEI